MLRERYINPLTDFGFKRIFGSEPNKVLLIDFLNVVLPAEHRVKDLTYRNNENVGNTTIDRKAIFDIYCESKTGERFIVEIQKAKQNYFKDPDSRAGGKRGLELQTFSHLYSGYFRLHL